MRGFGLFYVLKRASRGGCVACFMLKVGLPGWVLGLFYTKRWSLGRVGGGRVPCHTPRVGRVGKQWFIRLPDSCL